MILEWSAMREIWIAHCGVSWGEGATSDEAWKKAEEQCKEHHGYALVMGKELPKINGQDQ